MPGAGASATPQAVSGLAGVTAVAAGEYNTFAVLSDGTVWGWGMNTSGALGDGTTTDQYLPVRAWGGNSLTAGCLPGC